jgi:hypothetical protein
VTTVGTYTTLINTASATALTAGTQYFVQGTYVGGVFTVQSGATASTANYATLIVTDATGVTLAAETDVVILTGVLASDLSIANFV